MPRVAEKSDFESLPWTDWESQLLKAPNRALFFGPDDFGEMTPGAFKARALRAFKHLGCKVSQRGEEVLVVLDA